MLKTALATLSFTLALTSGLANAGEQIGMTTEVAASVVNDYRELRKNCAASVDQERKECFNRLNAANERYSLAKKILGTSDSEQDDVRYVTFAH